ncbi:hypothetical protein TNCV_2459721 [Trichonephila clavipes]|nr:hypothetical protein TNCV_2459721 [Trichonephila clavipes]
MAKVKHLKYKKNVSKIKQVRVLQKTGTVCTRKEQFCKGKKRTPTIGDAGRNFAYNRGKTPITEDNTNRRDDFYLDETWVELFHMDVNRSNYALYAGDCGQ